MPARRRSTRLANKNNVVDAPVGRAGSSKDRKITDEKRLATVDGLGHLPVSSEGSPSAIVTPLNSRARRSKSDALLTGPPGSGASTPRRYKSAVLVASRQGGAPPTPPPSFLVEDGPFAWLLYQPHTLSWLAVVLGIILYCGFMLPGPVESEPPTAEFATGGNTSAPSPENSGKVMEAQGVLSGSSPGGHHEKLGLLVVAIVFLCYCGIQLRDSVLLRPHPSFWRVVHGVGIIYLLSLVYLLMHSADSARRRVLPFFYPELGVKPANLETAYADDCRIYAAESDDPWKSIRETFFDIFTIAHGLGWVAKAIMLRDWRLLVILSLMWEILEYSLQDKLLNFHECWWDHWILDHTLCNMGGAAVGMLIVHSLDIDAYHWSWGGQDVEGEGEGEGHARSGMAKSAALTQKNHRFEEDEDEDEDRHGHGEVPEGAPSPDRERSAARRTRSMVGTGARVGATSGRLAGNKGSLSIAGLVRQLTPLQWVRYEWRMFSSWRRFVAVLGVLLTIEVVEINAFTMKHVLWVPPECPINPGRLVLWFFLAQPALHEWYLYIVDEEANRVGQNLWLATAVVIAETAVSVKFGTNFNDAPVPQVVWVAWGVALCALVLWLVLRFGLQSGVVFDGWMGAEMSGSGAGSGAGAGAGAGAGKPGRRTWLVAAQNSLLLLVLGMALWLIWEQEDGLGQTGCAETYGIEACKSRKW